MNGKKARQLRELAGVRTDKHNKQQYKQTNIKVRPVYNDELSPLGVVARKVAGTFETCTFALDAGSRSVYKALKKNYKAIIKLPHVA